VTQTSSGGRLTGLNPVGLPESHYSSFSVGVDAGCTAPTWCVSPPHHIWGSASERFL